MQVIAPTEVADMLQRDFLYRVNVFPDTGAVGVKLLFFILCFD